MNYNKALNKARTIAFVIHVALFGVVAVSTVVIVQTYLMAESFILTLVEGEEE
jgi:hypothetical protein